MSIHVVFFDLGETLVTAQRAWLPGAKAMLASLKAQGFRLGIISNTSGLADRTAILGILPVDFDLAVFEPALVLFSSEVGVEKPHRQIFEKAVAAASVPSAQCLFCTEEAVSTLVAQAVGLRSLRIVTRSTDLARLDSYLSDVQSNV